MSADAYLVTVQIAWRFTPFILPLVSAMFITAVLAFAALRRGAPGVIPFATLMAAISLWSLASALETGATDLAGKVLWTQLAYLGIVVVPLAWLAFALRYTGRLGRWWKRILALLSVEALVTTCLVWTNAGHGWLWTAFWLDQAGPFPVLMVSHGWWFWVHATDDYLALLVGTVLLVKTILGESSRYRAQTAAVLLGVLLPWFANVMYLLALGPVPNLDLTPFAFSLSGLALGWGLLRLGLLNAFFGLIPSARDAVVERMRDGVVVLDPHGRIVDLNPAAERVLGRQAHAVIGQALDALLEGWPSLAGAADAECHTEATLGVGAAHGIYEVLSAPLEPGEGKRSGRLVVLRDITERKEAEEAMRDSEARYRQQYYEMPVATYSWRQAGDDFVLEDYNRAAETITGGGIRAAIGGLASERYATMPGVFADLQACAAGQRTLRREMPFRRVNGLSELYLSVTYVFVPPNSVMIHTEDLTERKRAELDLRHQTLHDGLTGLPNRLLLNDRLEQTLRAATRENTSFGLLLLDLDRFKDVNDVLGHLAGDALLQLIGPRLMGVLSETDTLARLGGDEFAVLMPGTDEAGACALAARLLQALDEPFELETASVDVGGSIGVVTYPEHGGDAGSMLRRADVAMYVAKRAGGGWAVYESDQDNHSSARLVLRGELRQGIERDELRLYYQAKRYCRDGSLAGVEALVRWQHPRRGLVMPDDFIPLAEQTGLISSLSRWVLEAAVRQCRVWYAAGLHIPIAVNLSMRDLHDPHLPDTIEQLLIAWEIPPHLLHVEITESSLMVEPERARQTVVRLRSLGVHISIDDFGTGYSSLAYLKKLPVDELKIDRSFVSDMGLDPSDHAIVRSTIDLAHNLGLQVVAEGVEDEATWQLLVQLGCDEAQGYHLGRPQPAADLSLAPTQLEARSETSPPLAA